jgi:hypothetical protein
MMMMMMTHMYDTDTSLSESHSSILLERMLEFFSPHVLHLVLPVPFSSALLSFLASLL